MLSELSVLLCATLAAGILFGAILSALCLFGQRTHSPGAGAPKFSSVPVPDKLKSGLPDDDDDGEIVPYKIHNKSTGAPQSIWISKAGNQYHLSPECRSLRLAGMQRKGVIEYKCCGHCAKAKALDSHAD